MDFGLLLFVLLLRMITNTVYFGMTFSPQNGVSSSCKRDGAARSLCKEVVYVCFARRHCHLWLVVMQVINGTLYETFSNVRK